MKFKEILEKRHCTRDFKSKSPSFRDVAEILDSARYAPCAGGIYTVKIVIVDNKEIKAKLAEACLGQAFVAKAPYVLVVCSDLTQINRSYGKHAEMFAHQQAGAAVENMFLKASELGIGTCWVGAFDENAIKRILRIPENAFVEAVLPIGYEMGKALKKEKIELKKIVRFNDWSEMFSKGWETIATSKE